MLEKIVVLTGAGMSAESGISTFRDANGLWNNHNIMEVASPEGWRQNKELVLDFYNQRRSQLLECEPNAAHLAIADLEKDYRVSIVTQNVDDLHERAGSSNIIHLHGELLKARSTADESLVYDWKKDINQGDLCEKGSQLRPHIVWFGEEVPLLSHGATEVSTADIIIIVGTSMAVYPAAGLVAFSKPDTKVYYVDPNPQVNYELRALKSLTIIKEKATTGVLKAVDKLTPDF
jgi:NAD-dependent deacetylase